MLCLWFTTREGQDCSARLLAAISESPIPSPYSVVHHSLAYICLVQESYEGATAASDIN